MILSEFVLTHIKGESPLDWEYFADVSVTTGMLWWKKVERRKIHRKYVGYWHFVDTGKITSEFQAEELESAYEARQAWAEINRGIAP